MRAQWSLLILAFAASSVLAADADPIARRKEIFKGFGDATKPVVGMIKHQQDYDFHLVAAALDGYLAGTRTLPGLFPADSKTGGDTQAKPAIWDEKPKFEAWFASFGETCRAASASITDEASFRATMPKVLGACKGCHDEFREKK